MRVCSYHLNSTHLHYVGSLVLDRFYVALFSALEQTHCTEWMDDIISFVSDYACIYFISYCRTTVFKATLRKLLRDGMEHININRLFQAHRHHLKLEL